MRIQNQYLKSYTCQSEKTLNAPLAKKGYFIKLEEPVTEILEQMSSVERISLMRRAITQELKNRGLL